jgi:hypothetical protein
VEFSSNADYVAMPSGAAAAFRSSWKYSLSVWFYMTTVSLEVKIILIMKPDARLRLWDALGSALTSLTTRWADGDRRRDLRVWSRLG